MTQLLTFLQGKKWAIASIIGLIVTFLLSQGYIWADLAYLIGGISTVLFGAASYATNKILPTTPTS